MKKRLLIGLSVIGVCVLAGILVCRRNSERFLYHGKPVKAWAAQLYSPGPKSRDEAAAALEAMGTNAVPELIRMLRAKDSFFRKLGWSLPRAVPRQFRLLIVRNVRMPEAAFVQDSAARALAVIGPDAQAAIPALAQALRAVIAVVLAFALTAVYLLRHRHARSDRVDRPADVVVAGTP